MNDACECCTSGLNLYKWSIELVHEIETKKIRRDIPDYYSIIFKDAMNELNDMVHSRCAERVRSAASPIYDSAIWEFGRDCMTVLIAEQRIKEFVQRNDGEFQNLMTEISEGAENNSLCSSR